VKVRIGNLPNKIFKILITQIILSKSSSENKTTFYARNEKALEQKEFSFRKSEQTASENWLIASQDSFPILQFLSSTLLFCLKNSITNV